MGLEYDYGGDGGGTVFATGAFARPIGDLARTAGRIDEAIRLYRLAIDMDARIGAAPFLALGRLGLAKALVAKGETTEVGVLLTDADREFHRLGFDARLAESAAIRARWATSNPLSVRENEIAGLVGNGMSNRAIAEQLVLSERTVETHVRSILTKLGLANRREIAQWWLKRT